MTEAAAAASGVAEAAVLAGGGSADNAAAAAAAAAETVLAGGRTAKSVVSHEATDVFGSYGTATTPKRPEARINPVHLANDALGFRTELSYTYTRHRYP